MDHDASDTGTLGRSSTKEMHHADCGEIFTPGMCSFFVYVTIWSLRDRDPQAALSCLQLLFHREWLRKLSPVSGPLDVWSLVDGNEPMACNSQTERDILLVHSARH